MKPRTTVTLPIRHLLDRLNAGGWIIRGGNAAHRQGVRGPVSSVETSDEALLVRFADGKTGRVPIVDLGVTAVEGEQDFRLTVHGMVDGQMLAAFVFVNVANLPAAEQKLLVTRKNSAPFVRARPKAKGKRARYE